MFETHFVSSWCFVLILHKLLFEYRGFGPLFWTWGAQKGPKPEIPGCTGLNEILGDFM